MTQIETWEMKQAKEKARRKKQAEQDELMIMAYMSGNMGSVYMMEAAAQAVE
jgi:hypothetical protein